MKNENENSVRVLSQLREAGEDVEEGEQIVSDRNTSLEDMNRKVEELLNRLQR